MMSAHGKLRQRRPTDVMRRHFNISLFFFSPAGPHLLWADKKKSLVLTMRNSTSEKWIWAKGYKWKVSFFLCDNQKWKPDLTFFFFLIYFYVLRLVLNPRSSACRQRFIMRVKTWIICQITFKRTTQKAWTTTLLLAAFTELSPKPVVKRKDAGNNSLEKRSVLFLWLTFDIASTSLMA